MAPLSDMYDMHVVIQDALDEIASSKPSLAAKGRALSTLERVLAETCMAPHPGAMQYFLALQDTFECNIPSKLVMGIARVSPRLEALTTKDVDDERDREIEGLSAYISQSLNLIQGVALNHPASKRSLGRAYSLEIILDLLMVSRHLPAPTPPAADDRRAAASPLTSTVLDTLLCILVDAPPALRALEDAGGVQAVVKILKRAGTPREVRMKCLEFLYFYLMDETTGSSLSEAELSARQDTPIPSPLPSSLPSSSSTPAPARPAPNPPSLPGFPPPSSRRATPAHGIGLGHGHARSQSLASLTSRRSTSSSSSTDSSSSFSTASSGAGSSSSASSVASAAARPQPRSLLMLKKEVDYVPLSPKKAGIAQLGVGGGGSPGGGGANTNTYSNAGAGTPGGARRGGSALRASGLGLGGSPGPSIASRTAGRVDERGADRDQDQEQDRIRDRDEDRARERRAAGLRTTEEKKAILGGMLGNVDALVEGVRRAGIWGLG